MVFLEAIQRFFKIWKFKTEPRIVDHLVNLEIHKTLKFHMPKPVSYRELRLSDFRKDQNAKAVCLIIPICQGVFMGSDSTHLHELITWASIRFPIKGYELAKTQAQPWRFLRDERRCLDGHI